MMRTYCRKRPLHQVIEGVKDLCRLCLEAPEESVPLFTDGTDVCATLPMRIMICVGLEIVRDNHLPNMICKECYKELQRYYTFRKKCELSYQKLKSHLLAIKEREAKNNIKVLKNEEEKEVVDSIYDNNDVGGQHIILRFNDDQQLEIVNVEDYNTVIQVEKDVQEIEDITETSDSQSMDADNSVNEVQMQDISTANDSLEILPTVTDSETLSSILPAMLIQLGILAQQGDRFVVVNQNMRTIELEGNDGKIIMELEEEDELDVRDQASVQENGTSLRTDKPVDLVETAKTDSQMKVENDISSNDDITEVKKKSKQSGLCCSVCGKRFSTRSVLVRHARVHSGERPYVCGTCGRAFAQRAVLTRHALVHLERRPFTCGACGKGFTQRGALAAHTKSHAPPAARALALHRCTLCPKVFLYASGLTRHMGVHLGRAFACGACGRAFRDRSSLLRHVKSAAHGAKLQELSEGP